VLLVAAVIVLYGSLGRAIWIDEFIQFALGSHRSTAEAWLTVSATTVTMNHGQTGVYMMLDYWLLQLFGASATALRLPSLLSAALMFWGGVALLRARGLGYAWQVLLVVAFFSNATLMYYVGEARPYLPLAAATVGTLAYYVTPPPLRQRLPARALGFLSITWGALVHPYFSLYWLAVFLFAYLVARSEGTVEKGWRAFFSDANMTLSALGVLLYFGIGALTWLRGGPSFSYDPFEWVKRDRLVFEFVEVCHGNFLAGPRVIMMSLFAAVPVGVAVLPRRWRDPLRPLLAPAFLLVLALALSALIGWLSYRRHYWILHRQWVASMSLAVLAVVWLWAETARIANRAHRALGFLVLLLAVACVAPRAWEVLRERRQAFQAYLATPPPPRGELTSLAEPAAAPSDNDGWVALANANVRLGGPVWPIFRRYYGR
jgi:hypothetical protein